MKQNLADVFETQKIEVKLKEEVLRPEFLIIGPTSYGWDVSLRLPKGYSVEKFKGHLPALEQATASRIRLTHLKGRDILLELGQTILQTRMPYDPELIQDGALSVPYYTPFGLKYLNFHDESCCHLIVAGATRMGKTVFLRLLFAHLIAATKGKVQFFYINNKQEDYYPLMGVPQIPVPAETTADAFVMLNRARAEITRRKEILRASRDAVNVRQFNELHPDQAIDPLFVVFDEYGRFAEDEDLQDLVTEIAETAGYLDVHLVIATQRPDATTVLKPRIRANILTRVCFQTADPANSEIVVHTPDAYHLGEIRGRAIVLDGMPMLAQIPYIAEDQTMEMLIPFRREERAESPGPVDSELSGAFPSFVTGPVGEAHLSRCCPPVGHSQSHHETARPGRLHNHRAKAKR